MYICGMDMTNTTPEHKTIKFDNHCKGIVLETIEIGTLTIAHQETPLYLVNQGEMIFWAFQSAKGDYLAPVKCESQIIKITKAEYEYKFGKKALTN